MSTVRGTGRIEFTGGQFIDRDGTLVTNAPVGEPMILELDYERVDPDVREVRLDLAIRDGDQLVAQADNISAGQYLHVPSDVGSIRVEFAMLPWNSDTLQFNFSILDPVTSEVHDWKRNLVLNLKRQPLNQGSLRLLTQWTIDAASTRLRPIRLSER